MANTTTRYELMTCLKTGESCLILVDNETVTAIFWGPNQERREQWTRDMESGDAAGYIDLTDHLLDEPIPYDEFFEGMRIHATMTV